MIKKKLLLLLATVPFLLVSTALFVEAEKSEGNRLTETGSDLVCGDQLCSEDSSSDNDAAKMNKEQSETMKNVYVYTQDFLPRETLDIDLETTAIFITDPQNDFISEGGAAWAFVGEQVVEDNVVEHQVQLRETAKQVGIPVFYSPHTYTEMDYANWTSLNPIDKVMFEIDMFHEGTWGHEFHPDMIPDENTVVMNPHKGLSNFWTGDASLQLRQYGIQTIVLAGMSANLCVESHLRDAIENGFDVIVIADATAGAGPHSKNAALINYEFIAHEVTTTDDIIMRLNNAANP